MFNSSTSKTSALAFTFPNIVEFVTIVVTIPGRRLSPFRFEITLYPEYDIRSVIIFAVLVLPLVPVTRMIGPSKRKPFNISESIFKPIVPGSEPPRWNKCSICADNLVASMAKVRIIITPFTRLLYTSWH